MQGAHILRGSWGSVRIDSEGSCMGHVDTIAVISQISAVHTAVEIHGHLQLAVTQQKGR